MSKKEKIAIGILIGVVLIAFAVALTWDVIGPSLRIWKAQDLPRDIDKVRMEFKKGTLTPKRATILIYDNNAYDFLYHSEDISIQKREGNEWKEAKWKREFRIHYAIGEIYSMKENPIEMIVGWSRDYEELTEGMYRLTIHLTDENDGRKEYEKYLYFQVIEMAKIDKETGNKTLESIAVEKTKEEAEALQKNDITITNATIQSAIPQVVEEPYLNPGTPRDITKVKLTFKSGTLTNKGATIYIYDDNDYHFAYQGRFRIEKRVDDEWKELPVKEGYILPGANGAKPRPKNPFEMELVWKWVYGELESGIYRLATYVTDENDGNKEYAIYGYFQVTRAAMLEIPSGKEETPIFPTHEITQREAEETEEERKERENNRLPISGSDLYSGIGIIPGTDCGGEAE